LVARESAQCQEGVNKSVHELRGSTDVPDELQDFRIKPAGAVLEQGFDEAVDLAQRRAQIMGDRVVERLLFFINGFELNGALPDASLQFGIELMDCCFGLLARGNVADVALNHFMAVFYIDVSDTVHLLGASSLCS